MMDEILVLVEHRQGEIRDITFEMLSKGRELTEARGARLTALLLGSNLSKLAEALTPHAERVEIAEAPGLELFNSETYQKVLAPLIRSRHPALVLMGHTSYGLDLAPGLAAEVGLPLITDVTDVDLVDGGVVAVRPIYGGKARARVRAREGGAIVTVQSGAFPVVPGEATAGQVVRADVPTLEGLGRKRVLGFIDAPVEDVDITQSDIVVSVGRGIADPENLHLVEELATALGGVLACSRPVVDRKWLPKSRQVGISGKTVRPKLYLAVGISGAFQHLAGMNGSKTIVAINKDPNAPIFQVAGYSVVADLFALVPALTERIVKAKTKRVA